MEDVGAGQFEELLAGTLRNDPRAAEELFRRFHPPLLRYLRARETHHAEDLAGDVWLAVAAHLDGFEGDERAFRAWLFTLARNVVTGHRRKGLRRRTDLAATETFELRPTDAETDGEAIESVAAAEAIVLLERHLTRTQAEVVRLRVIAGLSATEVAEILDRPETWVRVTQHRALQRLAKRLPGRTV